MKKFFGIIVALSMIFICSTAFASEKLIEASGSYIMDSRLDETPASATARAREEAKRIAIEQAGIYLQSYSKMIDFELSVDEVNTIAAHIIKIQKESSTVEVVEKNLLKFIVTIEALVDATDEMNLKAMMQDKQTLEELTRKNKELQEKYDALNRQMEQYRNNFDKANDKQKAEIKKKVAINTEKFSAVDEFAKGNNFSLRKDYGKALSAYDAAIRLDPQLAEAYNNRGIVKFELGQFSSAIEDYTRAIQLKANYFEALNNRGNAYIMTEQFQNAERDLRMALKLNDKSADVHNNLGSVYYSEKNFEAAIKEYTQAIQLNPNFADAYYNRAVTHYMQGNLIQSLIDIKKARELKSDDTDIKSLLEKISREAN